MSRTPDLRVGALVAAAHLLLVWGLLVQPPWRWATGELASRPPLTVRLLSEHLTPAQPRTPVDTAQPRGSHPVARARAVGRAPQAITAPEAPAVATLEATSPPASSASAPLPRLLDTGATRRAILDAARTTSWQERGDQAIAQTHLRPEQKLGRDVAESARGNCAKGEFAGGGLGLLSLPFFVAAEVSGKCR